MRLHAFFDKIGFSDYRFSPGEVAEITSVAALVTSSMNPS